MRSALVIFAAPAPAPALAAETSLSVAMKPTLVSSVLMLVATLCWPVYAVELPTLPDALGQWYKPLNKRQVWLHTMFGLRREMQAVEEYVARGDAQRATKWVEAFVRHYGSIGEMVPDWSDELDLDALGDYEVAAKAADAGALAAAGRDLRRTCTSCHRDYRALAAARYRSADFSDLKVGELAFGQAMEELSRTVNRIQIAVADARWSAAEENLAGLEDRLAELGGSCGGCHRDEPPVARILGPGTQQGLDALRREIAARDPRAAGRRLGAIAVEVCARCHGVHRTLYGLQQRISR